MFLFFALLIWFIILFFLCVKLVMAFWHDNIWVMWTDLAVAGEKSEQTAAAQTEDVDSSWNCETWAVAWFINSSRKYNNRSMLMLLHTFSRTGVKSYCFCLSLIWWGMCNHQTEDCVRCMLYEVTMSFIYLSDNTPPLWVKSFVCQNCLVLVLSCYICSLSYSK